MAAVLGKDAKMYYQSSGVRATWPGSGAAPNLVEMTNVKDASTNLEKDEADLTTRGSGGWKITVPTFKDGTVEFEMVWDTADAGFVAIQNAYFGDATIAIAVLDGLKDAAGSKGLWADFGVAKFSRNEPLTEALTVSVTLKPGYSTVAPEWVTVA